jgi:hypothetical protein
MLSGIWCDRTGNADFDKAYRAPGRISAPAGVPRRHRCAFSTQAQYEIPSFVLATPHASLSKMWLDRGNAFCFDDCG